MSPITTLNVVLCIVFLVGLGLRILSRAGFAIRNPVNPVSSRWQFVKNNWDTMLIRSFWDSLAFGYWLTHPTAFGDFFNLFHLPFNFNVPTNIITAPGFGFLIDSGFDWLGSAVINIPQLKVLGVLLGGTIPPLPSVELVQKAHEEAAKKTDPDPGGK